MLSSRVFSFLLTLALVLPIQAGIDLHLPTENHNLFTGDYPHFYTYVDRLFEGQKTQPWEGGTYGNVRNPIRVGEQVICTKFHEGIDICPLQRDSAGNPLDTVRSIAEGTVSHTSPIAGRSNYGKYVVVEHRWENSSVYSLYAHLAEITCKPGDPVKAGDPLGKLGFTGAGINKARAHVHLELTMMLNTRFDDFVKGAPTPNYHGNFNGLNLSGCDIAQFYLAQKKNPELKFSDFIASTPAYYRVTIPAKGKNTTPDFIARYPWICRGNTQSNVSWEITFSATGLPLAFTPSQRPVDAPTITAVRSSDLPHSYATHHLLTGQGTSATLTNSGKQIITLLMDDFPIPPIISPEQQAAKSQPTKTTLPKEKS